MVLDNKHQPKLVYIKQIIHHINESRRRSTCSRRASGRIRLLPQTIDHDGELLYGTGTAGSVLDGEAEAAEVHKDGVGDAGNARIVTSHGQRDCAMLFLFHIQSFVLYVGGTVYLNNHHGRQHRYQVQLQQFTHKYTSNYTNEHRYRNKQACTGFKQKKEKKREEQQG